MKIADFGAATSVELPHPVDGHSPDALDALKVRAATRRPTGPQAHRPTGPQARTPAGPHAHRPAGPQARRPTGPQAHQLSREPGCPRRAPGTRALLSRRGAFWPSLPEPGPSA
eukprot:4350697-Prymnesium_polylepis.1